MRSWRGGSAFSASRGSCADRRSRRGARADDDYPNHPVRWLVGYPPGGSTDICARLIGQYLSEHLHQQFAHREQAGRRQQSRDRNGRESPPDGYTVFLVNPANAINATLYKNLSFNFIQDMAPVAGFIRVPNVMEVNPNVPAKTVAEFIAYAKANPGKVNMASSGIGTSVHLSGALFMMMTGVDLSMCPIAVRRRRSPICSADRCR
jgi:tripartite-type tricarboxylate transporter receptor subunit TctC